MNTVSRTQLTPMPEPDYAISPGETLRERLEDLGMSQAELGRRTGLTPKHINQVLKGSASVSSDVATRLEYATGTPARWWLRLEADYRAALARLNAPEWTQEQQEWAESMPVRALVRAGVLPEAPGDTAARVGQLLRFFGVANLEAYRRMWREPVIAFRQSSAYRISDPAVAAWLRVGELAVQDAQLTAIPFDRDVLISQLPALRALTREPVRAGVTALVNKCAIVGVAVALVPEIAGSRVFGATRWLTTRRPLIQLSLRGKSDDKLWFTVFHEIGHVLLHDRRRTFVEADSDMTPKTSAASDPEREANDFAWDLLIPQPARARLDTVTTTEEALDLAEELQIAPALLALRLEREGRWAHRDGARLRRPVDFDVLSATADDDAPRSRRRAPRGLPGETQ